MRRLPPALLFTSVPVRKFHVLFPVPHFGSFSSRIAGLILLFAALSATSCERRPAPPITKINDEAASPSRAPDTSPFAAIAEKVGRAVVVLAIFDEHGGLVANQHGFFVSAEGDLIAERTAMNNAASAVLKGADGRAYDTLGTYVRSSSPYFILLKTNARNVPHLDSSAAAGPVADGAPAAIIFSAADEARASFLQGRITGGDADETGDWLTFEPSPPKTALGAPVVDASGAIVGIVAQRRDREPPAIVRYTGITSAPAADVSTEELSASSASVASPAEGPDESSPPEPQPSASIATPPLIAGATRVAEIDPNGLQPEVPAPFATPKGFFIRMNPNWHLHAKNRPSQSGNNAPRPRLLYTPAPRYPFNGAPGEKTTRAGSYRVTFDDRGEVSDVQVTRTAGSGALDQAAIATLRNWRSEPGREWRVVVPITFK